jgi:hypothetical protein
VSGLYQRGKRQLGASASTWVRICRGVAVLALRLCRTNTVATDVRDSGER